MKFTPTKWAELTGVEIIDPDGWPRSNKEQFDAHWNREINVNEFWNRCCNSTCRGLPSSTQQLVQRVIEHLEIELTMDALIPNIKPL